MDAKYLTGYDLRITDGGTALTGTHVARIALGAPPAVQLSPGQRQGVPVVDGPKDRTQPALPTRCCQRRRRAGTRRS